MRALLSDTEVGGLAQVIWVVYKLDWGLFAGEYRRDSASEKLSGYRQKLSRFLRPGSDEILHEILWGKDED